MAQSSGYSGHLGALGDSFNSCPATPIGQERASNQPPADL